MKILFLFVGIIACYLTSSAQSFSSSKNEIESGEEVTITASGETNSAYFSSISVEQAGMTSTPDNFASTYVSLSNINSINYFNAPIANTPTSFKLTITNSHPTTDYTITFKVRTTISAFPGSPTPNVIKTVTLTVRHPPVWNDLRSAIFYKNNCGPGYSSDPYTFSVPAHTYSARTKAEANALADSHITSNGQNAANLNSTCKLIYYSGAISGSFTRNNCGSGYTPGDPVPFSIPLGQITSLISQADADSKAAAYLNTQGQINANNNGICNEVRIAHLSSLRSSACSAAGEVTTTLWLKDFDFDIIPQFNSVTGIYAYTTQIGNNKAPAGYYAGLYSKPSDGNFIRVYNISTTGEITGYTLCPVTPPANANQITVSALTYPSDNTKRTINLSSVSVYSQNITVTGIFQAVNAAGVNVLGGGNFSVTLTAGQNIASKDIFINLPILPSASFKLKSVSASPSVVDGKTIVFKLDPVF